MRYLGIISVIGLLFSFPFESWSDLYKLTATVLVEDLPHNEQLLMMSKRDQSLANSIPESVTKEMFRTASKNNEEIFRNGFSYSYPVQIEVNYNPKANFINSYRMEYYPPIIDVYDPTFSTSSPKLRYDYKAIITHDYINEKRTFQNIDIKGGNSVTITQNDDRFHPELAFEFAKMLSELATKEPVKEVKNGSMSQETFLYHDQEITIQPSLRKTNVGPYTITGAGMNVSFEYDSGMALPKRVELISGNQKIKIILSKPELSKK